LYKAFMRKAHFTFWLAVAACAWVSAPRALAGGEQDSPRPAGQWRLFPHPPFAGPADAELISRIGRQIDPLAALLKRSGSDGAANLGDALIEIDARNQLFKLEGILRLYARAFPDLDRYRLVVKEIEDGLGGYSLAVDSLKFAKDKFKDENEARAPGAARKAEQDKIIAALEKKKEAARVAFEKLANRSAFTVELPELRSALPSTFVGWSASRDLAYVKSELQRPLRNVRERRFNFNHLEEGNGIHEFRRQLRWFPIVIDALDGLVVVGPNTPGACPAPALESLAGSRAARHRYANPALRNPATHPCTISRCLLWQVVKTVDDIGRLKDEVLGEAAVETALVDFGFDITSKETITPAEIARAKESRSELYSSRALDLLIDQLNSCKP
jgi:hypothetical protein